MEAEASRGIHIAIPKTALSRCRTKDAESVHLGFVKRLRLPHAKCSSPPPERRGVFELM
jgi:hypothetical protein